MADIDLPLSWRMMQDGYLMEINKLRDENTRLSMSEFVWHDMGEEQPTKEYGDFIVLGSRNGIYLAKSYIDAKWGRYFVETRGRHIYADKVKAWAEIPAYVEGR